MGPFLGRSKANNCAGSLRKDHGRGLRRASLSVVRVMDSPSLSHSPLPRKQSRSGNFPALPNYPGGERFRFFSEERERDVRRRKGLLTKQVKRMRYPSRILDRVRRANRNSLAPVPSIPQALCVYVYVLRTVYRTQSTLISACAYSAELRRLLIGALSILARGDSSEEFANLLFLSEEGSLL